MSGKGGSAPEAPDPYKTAAAESQFNRFDTFNPTGGGIRQGYTDASGNFVSGVAPEGSQSAQQYLEGDTERLMREALEPASLQLTQQILGENLGAGLPEAARVKNFDAMAKELFDVGYGRMKPQFEAENERLLTNLQARGIPIGSEAFGESYGQQQQSVNDAMSKLTMDATMAAGGEQSRQFGLDQAQRSGAISELVAAMGGGFNPPSPTPSGQGSSVNYSGLVGDKYKNDLAAYNAQQEQSSANMSTVGSLGSAMLMKCTVSAKAIEGSLNVKKASYAIQNMPLFGWSYLKGQEPEGFGQEPHVGPMAESFHHFTGLGTPDTINVVDIVGILTGALQDALHRIEVLEYRANGGSIQ